MKILLRIALLIATTSIYMSAKADYKPVDLMSDDFSVLRYVGNLYLTENYPGQSLKIKRTFGLSFVSYGDKPYPKRGFIGYEMVNESDEETVLKLQLYKDSTGWQFDQVLDNPKIDQAHPTHQYESGHPRTDQAGKARQAAARVLEDWLNNENQINDVRSTSMQCYLSKSLEKASCRGIYGLKTGDEVECRSKTYYLSRSAEEWRVTEEIRDDQKVNYNTGDLETQKPFSLFCS